MMMGDLDGDGRMELVTFQPDGGIDDRYIPHEARCLTAFDLTGDGSGGHDSEPTAAAWLRCLACRGVDGLGTRGLPTGDPVALEGRRTSRDPRVISTNMGRRLITGGTVRAGSAAPPAHQLRSGWPILEQVEYAY